MTDFTGYGWHQPSLCNITIQHILTAAFIFEDNLFKRIFKWATTRHIVSSGVSDTNRPAQPQKLASLEISAIESKDIILSKQRTTKALIRLRGCAGWSAPLLFAYDIRHIFSWPGSNKRWRNGRKSVAVVIIQSFGCWLFFFFFLNWGNKGCNFAICSSKTLVIVIKKMRVVKCNSLG